MMGEPKACGAGATVGETRDGTMTRDGMMEP